MEAQDYRDRLSPQSTRYRPEDLSPPEAYRDIHRGCRSFSLETGGGLQRYSFDGLLGSAYFDATSDGSTFDDVEGGGIAGCIGYACSWMGADGWHRLSTAFVNVPHVRGSACAELFGFRLLCRRLLQVSGQAGDGCVRASTPVIRDGCLRVRIDNEDVIRYLNRLLVPSRDSDELQHLVERCLAEKADVEAAYACRVDVFHGRRRTAEDHTLCDHAARQALRAGFHGRALPGHPSDWNLDVRLVSRLARAHRMPAPAAIGAIVTF
jgi:hypothetical protein